MVATARRTVVLFTKPARPGAVKTRLIGPLSADQAAALHQAFLDDLIERLSAGPYRVRVAWAVADDEPLPSGDGLRQRGADLGERLFDGLTEAAREADFVLAIGSDHPELGRARVVDAFERLERGAPAVIGPALDGGYCLIGFAARRIPRRAFEEIPWSGPRTLAVTRERLAEIGCDPVLLEASPDVDTPADLAALARRLAARPERSPRTAALLSDWEIA
jgi:rSAM/selenodomain-associated transferase 1